MLPRRVVSEWSGIGDADGVAIEPSLEAFGMLFQDALFLHAFESFAFVNLYHEAREGE
ncbi:hypothetical protein [uncultured Cohaesibacter sp.]|uniref:hypothetical protein n=1 Tax=uncultured Cohaesibacter sp. TaxID=1002546 RepID=UPI0029C85F87|nr:hypothetical protein [uncultured Cohaesibacter sp.]